MSQLQLADLKKMEREIEVDSVAGCVTIVYRLGDVTETALEEHDKPGFESVLELLERWLVRWDLMDGEEMYPTNLKSLKELPRSFLLDVFSAINQDVRIRPTKRAGSFGDTS